MKKVIAPILLLLIFGAIGTVGYVVFGKHQTQQGIEQAENAVQSVKGLIGSEKALFFQDQRVIDILKNEYKLNVEFQTAGSRAIANKITQESYDFAFPSGEPAAEKIKQTAKVFQSYRAFFTPMTVASWKPVVDVLEKNGIVEKRQSYYGILDMKKLLGLMENKTRWKDLPNNEGFDIGRKVLIKSTNITKSNSAAMYLSLASYLYNGDEVVNTAEQAKHVVARATPLFASQGFQPNSSATPFNDYLVKGMGNSPMVMMYESQYLYEATQGGTRPEMVLLYPEPTIYTQHIVLAITMEGERLGDALMNNPELQRLAIEHGFRSNDRKLLSAFEENLTKNKLENIPSQLNEVIPTPSYDLLEQMILDIEQAMS